MHNDLVWSSLVFHQVSTFVSEISDLSCIFRCDINITWPMSTDAKPGLWLKHVWNNTSECMYRMDYFQIQSVIEPVPPRLYMSINYNNNTRFIVYIIPSSLYKILFELGYCWVVKFSKVFFSPSLPAEPWTAPSNDLQSSEIYSIPIIPYYKHTGSDHLS